jgi:threonine/homoserine/homoserine lactone efflux protein
MNLIDRASAYEWKFLKLRNDDLSLGELANSVIDLLLMVAGIIAVIYLIYSGFLYITAAGNADNAKKGQQGIINAIIGIVIIALAWVIANTVAGFTSQV